MNVLIIGSGGREHAIAWKISQSPSLGKLYTLPGNPGTSSISENIDVDVRSFEEIKRVVISKEIDLVIVGPEEPLVKGLGDLFSSDELLNRVLFIGPCADGARLEGSKDFSKEFMRRWSIPTAQHRTFDADSSIEAERFLSSMTSPYVIKADGLAAGKGVIISDNIDEALDAMREIFAGKFGDAGKRVVIEQFLKGIELSVFVLTDGKDYMILPEAKDYKRIGDGDTGLNTGGMGAVSPVPFANKDFLLKVEERIVKPTITGLRSEGIDYKGFIFIGLMNCGGDPFVIEYNVRMGDPETEVVIPRIKSDLLGHLIAVGRGTLRDEKLETISESAVTVMAVSGGYPESYTKGIPIAIDAPQHSTYFHAGTKRNGAEIVTNGGRVMAVTALGSNIREALCRAYGDIRRLNFKNMYYRGDIGADLLDPSTWVLD